jgi:hypothetical protein
MKKPNPNMLGTGSAAKAGKKAQSYRQRMDSEAARLMREIQASRTGTQKHR